MITKGVDTQSSSKKSPEAENSGTNERGRFNSLQIDENALGKIKSDRSSSQAKSVSTPLSSQSSKQLQEGSIRIDDDDSRSKQKSKSGRFRAIQSTKVVLQNSLAPTASPEESTPKAAPAAFRKMGTLVNNFKPQKLGLERIKSKRSERGSTLGVTRDKGKRIPTDLASSNSIRNQPAEQYPKGTYFISNTFVEKIFDDITQRMQR